MHVPFLEEAAGEAVGGRAQVGLGVFLTLRLVDSIARRDLEGSSVRFLISSVRDFLNDLDADDEEVVCLKRIVGAAEGAFHECEPRLLWPPVTVLAVHLQDKRRWDQALDVLETALTLSDGRDAGDEVLTHMQRGRVLLCSSRPREAYEAYAVAEAMAGRIGQTEAASRLLGRVGMGAALRDLDDLASAWRVLNEASRDAERDGHWHAEAEACRELSAVCERTGELPDAAALKFRSLALFVSLLDKGRMLAELGALLQRIGWYDAARDAYSIVVEGEYQQHLRTRAIAGLLDVAALAGDRIGFEILSRRIGSLEEELGAEALIDIELALGRGYWIFGRRHLAKRHVAIALEVARERGLSEEADRAGALLRVVCGDDPVDSAAAGVQFRDDPQLLEVAAGLKRLRGADWRSDSIC
jgi:tetratricopeptide (TPR) repeat protein